MPREKYIVTVEWLLAQTLVEGDCFVWQRTLNNDGYGRVTYEKKTQNAHRVMWKLIHGPLNTKQYVCHTCDNPPCINIEHLFVGTQDDNMKDSSRKWRMHVGEKSHTAILTEEEAELIYDILHPKDGSSTYGLMRKIAKAYGVSYDTVTAIKYGRSWKYLHYKKDESYGGRHLELQ